MVIVYCEALNVILLFSNIFLIIYGFSKICILISHLMLTTVVLVQTLSLGIYTVFRTSDRPEVQKIFLFTLLVTYYPEILQYVLAAYLAFVWHCLS